MVLAEDLRQAVLQAALQGKLTKQLETDSNVDEMLMDIAMHREEIKECKNTLNLEAMDVEIPDSWRMVEINSILSFVDYRGKTPNKTEKGVFLITASNIKKGYMDYTRKEYISEEEYKARQSRGITSKGDLLFTTEAPLGNAALCDLDITSCGQRIITMQKYCDNTVCLELFMYFILSSAFQNELVDNCTGTTAKGIKADKLKHLLIPFPPIEEQQRIVDKINKIMPKIDEYEKIEKELETLKKRFPTNMKDALLQAAMQGKLTEQLESDSSVDEFLEAIRQEKEELIAQKIIKKEKPLSNIEEEEIPFDIPENWRWVRLGNIGTLTRGNGIKRNEVIEIGFPCVRYGELYTTYKTKFDVAVSHTSQEIFDKAQKVHANDILMALTGENNFDIALALAYMGEEVIAMGGDLTRWSNHHMNPLYLVYVMNSSYAIHKKSEMAKGDIIVHISNDKLATILLPIPPIEEQNRIVERLEALLPLCEELKE